MHELKRLRLSYLVLAYIGMFVAYRLIPFTLLQSVISDLMIGMIVLISALSALRIADSL